MNKKKTALITLILMSVMLCSNVNAGQFKARECEYTDEYIRWMNLSDEEKENVIEPMMCKIENNSYDKTSADATLSRYSLKDEGKVLGVRNQQNSESCWAYSSSASVESNLLMQGKTTEYLSPSHMELLTQNTYKVPNIETYVRTFNSGASGLTAGAYYLNHWGPVYETDFPETNTFNAISDKTFDTSTINVGAKFDVDNMTILGDGTQGKCSNDTISDIKNYLVTNGALGAAMYWGTINTYYESTEASTGAYLAGDYLVGPYYYYDGSSSSSTSANSLPNHGVTIVGWDDNVDPSSFVHTNGTNTSGKTPSRKGAWIIKNSYGKSLTISGKEYTLGDDGYFYVSYDDINICSNLYGFNGVNDTVSDNAYYYDYMNYNDIIEFTTTSYYEANKFTKKTSGNEKIEKVSFVSPNAGIKYSIYINNINNLIATGTTEFAGYESINLDKSVVVDKDFSIIVKLDTSYMTLSRSKDSNGYVITPNVSYVSTDGVKFDNLSSGSDNYQANIRVYTNNTAEAAGNFGNNLNETGDSIEVTNPNPTITTAVSNPKTGIEDHKEVLMIAIVGSVFAIILTGKNKFRRI